MNLLLLPLLWLLGFSLIGCAKENTTPYTEQTAKIDPAMNTPDATNPADPDRTTPPPLLADDPALKSGGKVELTDAQWKAILSDEEYDILRQSGTERAWTGRYVEHPKSEKGAFYCVGCGNKLYDAKHKFHSGCGWPSFNQGIEPGALTIRRDRDGYRVEMRCARCGGHLGHIFDDAPDQPTGKRHCVNGNVILFVPEGADVKEAFKAHRAKYADR